MKTKAEIIDFLFKNFDKIRYVAVFVGLDLEFRQKNQPQKVYF